MNSERCNCKCNLAIAKALCRVFALTVFFGRPKTDLDKNVLGLRLPQLVLVLLVIAFGPLLVWLRSDVRPYVSERLEELRWFLCIPLLRLCHFCLRKVWNHFVGLDFTCGVSLSCFVLFCAACSRSGPGQLKKADKDIHKVLWLWQTVEMDNHCV